MTISLRARMLVRMYPPAWRARYGDELEELIASTSSGRGPSVRACANIAIAALRERLQAAGLSGADAPPGERARSGSLLVLWAWLTFVLAGIALQRASEHWQASTPVASRGLPSLAFTSLVIVSLVASALVLAMLAAALPALVRFLRQGGWGSIRRPVRLSAGSTALSAAAGVGLVAWAHRLDVPQRNGHDLAYATGFAIVALALAASLVGWTVTATVVARRIGLSATVLRIDALLALAVTIAMGCMTALTLVWWETTAFGLDARLAIPTAVMACASAAGGFGSARAMRASASS